MKKIICILLVLLVTFSGMPVLAHAAASEKAMEKASEDSVFNRIGDWWATKGMDKEQKKKVIGERKAERAMERARRSARKKQKDLDREMKKKHKSMKKQMGR